MNVLYHQREKNVVVVVEPGEEEVKEKVKIGGREMMDLPGVVVEMMDLLEGVEMMGHLKGVEMMDLEEKVAEVRVMFGSIYS